MPRKIPLTPQHTTYRDLTPGGVTQLTPDRRNTDEGAAEALLLLGSGLESPGSTPNNNHGIRPRDIEVTPRGEEYICLFFWD
jgi:hypothetical protein